jgi:hypothetical protein
MDSAGGSIRRYNELAALDPLPMQASIEKDLPLPYLQSPASHLLVFWGHVAHVTSISSDMDTMLYDIDFGQKITYDTIVQRWQETTRAITDCGDTNKTIEVDFVFISIDWTQEGNESYHGIYIARKNGVSHRMGMPKEPLEREKRLAGNPKKELIFLVQRELFGSRSNLTSLSPQTSSHQSTKRNSNISTECAWCDSQLIQLGTIGIFNTHLDFSSS